MIISSPASIERRLPRILAATAALVGLTAWVVFYRAGLVLSHYDAKAHLVVARRVIDSLTPGWQQVGAVWLPLPHLIELLPIQVDLFYRTGAFASLVSIGCLAVTTYAAARLVLRVTGSGLGAAVCTALLTLNPNVLYLHTTPMTEPLLLASSMLVVLWLYEWAADGRDTVPPKLALALFAAAWTRYEAWAVIGAALGAAGYASWRRGSDAATLLRRWSRVAVWPILAVVIFLINSRITVGAWFVSEGFYVPDATYAHQAVRTLLGIWWGTHRMSGYVVEAVALGAAAVVAWRSLAQRDHAPLLIALSLFAAAAVPIVAFYDGHPYRIRYMIPVVAACAVFCGLAVGLIQTRMSPAFAAQPLRRGMPGAAQPLRRGRRVGAALVAALLPVSLLVESPLWSPQAPMLLEAQWDHRASLGRRNVTTCLARGYAREKILVSMGSLAHYMQELSVSGFAIADFIHEGNGPIWRVALQTGPAPHAGWMLVEEVAEGGDVLAERIRRDPAFTRDMTRVCQGGGVALYRRHEMQNAKFKMQTAPAGMHTLPGADPK